MKDTIFSNNFNIEKLNPYITKLTKINSEIVNSISNGKIKVTKQ